MSKTVDEVVAELSQVCRAIAAGADLQWEWDGRFGCALATLKEDRREAVLTLLATHFPEGRWESSTIGTAPETVGAIAKAWGLRGGQALYTLDPAAEPLLFAAWWPWGGNTTFSLRIGLKLGASDHDGEATLRACFGL